MNLQEAIDCPEFNTEHAPSSFYPRAANPGHLDARRPLSGGDGAGARRRAAIACISARTWSGGRLTACAREETPEGRILKAGANPRGMQSYAAGR